MVETRQGLGDGSLLLWIEYDPGGVSRREQLSIINQLQRSLRGQLGIDVGTSVVDNLVVIEMGPVGIQLDDLPTIATKVEEELTVSDLSVGKVWVTAGKEVVTSPFEL